MSVTTPPALDLRTAAFGYGGRVVVEHLTFDVPAGQVVAVVGPNGSGKSTFVKGVLGLADHLAGDFCVFGQAPGTRATRRRIGYVPQRHTLSASVRATVREIVETGRLAHRPWYRPAGADDRAAVEAALAQVGLSDHINAEVSDLSGGQQRRVLIARALAGRPDMLIMDEPNAGVDVASQDVLAEVLHRLSGEGTTMLIVTHELSALRGILDRIVEIAQGRTTFDGTPAQWADQEHNRILATAAHDGHCGPADEQRAAYASGPWDCVELPTNAPEAAGGRRA